MMAPLTRSPAAAYRSRVGSESLSMGLGQGPAEARTPEPRRVHRCAVSLWSGGRIAPALRGVVGQPTPSVGSWPSLPARPPERRPSAPVTGCRNRLARSLAMLESRYCRRALAGGRAP